MNKARRKRLLNISAALFNYYWNLQEVIEEEQEALDNILESLHETEKYEKDEEFLSKLIDYTETIEELVNFIEEEQGND